MKEQKPNDLIEKEVKQESEDFYKNVKEEPLEEEYFEEVVPKLEKVINLQTPSISEVNDFATEVKLEGQSLSSYQFEKEIKQEAESLLEKVKEEPLDEEDFKKEVSSSREIVDPWLQSNSNLFDMPNDEFSNSSSQIVKQEPFCSEPRSVEAMDDVKMEQIKDYLIKKITERQKQRVDNRRCSVCCQFKLRKIIKDVRLVHDKLIIMIKCVLRGEYTLAKAQSFVSEKNVFICHAHFSEALNEICSALCIQKLEELPSCSSQLMQNLMVTVNHLLPQTSALDFCDILNNFTTRNHHIFLMVHLNMKLEEQKSQNRISNENKNRSETGTSKTENHRCSVCARMKPSNELKRVQSEDTRFVIMIGCLLCGDYTLQWAQLFLSKKMRQFICNSHFNKALNEIYSVLRIQNLEEIYSCSSESMQNLMVTVKAFRPQLSIMDFSKILRDFIGRNLNNTSYEDK